MKERNLRARRRRSLTNFQKSRERWNKLNGRKSRVGLFIFFFIIIAIFASFAFVG